MALQGAAARNWSEALYLALFGITFGYSLICSLLHRTGGARFPQATMVCMLLADA
jgi:hypothetical protein